MLATLAVVTKRTGSWFGRSVRFLLSVKARLLTGTLLFGVLWVPIVNREAIAERVRSDFECACIDVDVRVLARTTYVATPARALDAREQVVWQHLVRHESRRRPTVAANSFVFGVIGRAERNKMRVGVVALHCTPHAWSVDRRRLAFLFPWWSGVPMTAVGIALAALFFRQRRSQTVLTFLVSELRLGAVLVAAFALLMSLRPTGRDEIEATLYADLRPAPVRVEAAFESEATGLRYVVVRNRDPLAPSMQRTWTFASQHSDRPERQRHLPDLDGRIAITCPPGVVLRPGDETDVMFNEFGARLRVTDCR